MRFAKFAPEHLDQLLIQPAQSYAREVMQDKDYGASLVGDDAFTGFIDDRVVACIGVLPIWEGRGEAWAMIARDIGPKGMHELHYSAKQYFRASTLRRIEASCDATFEQAKRWLLMLGFEYEGLSRKYSPDGRDFYRFARVK